MTPGPVDVTETYAIVHAEVGEGVASIETSLLAVEREPHRTEEHLVSVLATAHTLKGACSTLGLNVTGKYIHGYESCVEKLKDEGVQVDDTILQALYDGLDVFLPLLELEMGRTPEIPAALDRAQEGLRRLFGDAVAPARPDVEAMVQAATPDPTAAISKGFLRVSTGKIDQMLNGTMELLTVRGAQEQHAAEVENLRDTMQQINALARDLRTTLEAWQRQGAARGSQLVLDRLRQVAATQAKLSSSAHETLARLDDRIRVDRQTFDALAERLIESSRAIRLVPVETAFASLHRLVRDVSTELDRDVTFHVSGGETELDRDVLDVVRAALVHLVRNALDHGIESPEERLAAGKKRRGTLELVATSFGGQARIELRDDGRGISPERIGHLALTRGLVSEAQLEGMSEHEIRGLIFEPGFSSSAEVTNISGRGVGLDAVRRTMRELGGRVHLESNPEGGTCFVLTLPVSQASVDLVFFRAGGAVLALPASRIARISHVDRKKVSRVKTGLAVEIDGKPLSLTHLSDVLSLPADELGSRLTVLTLRGSQREIGFTVDEVLDHREALAKGLGDHLGRVPNVLGTTVLSDGEVIPILHAEDLVENAIGGRVRSALAEQEDHSKRVRHRVLVADDSITTRTLQKGILESAGYEVIVATDGMEALERLRTTKVDLVLTDVEMPRMDGIALTKRIKSDEHTRDLPVIVVSSLGSEEHRARGVQAGADAYVAKGEFDQGQLLATVARLL